MFVGIDLGSVTTKGLIINDNSILAFSMLPTGFDHEEVGEKILKLVLEKAGKSKDSIKYMVSTGYGRKSLSFSNKTLPEILCHAEGTKSLFPKVKTIIDIGGQDSKVIELDEGGNVVRFEMNDKCAAGTGRFLEVLSERILNVDIKELGPLSLRCKRPCMLSSVCTVFAESEVISYLSTKRSREDIAYGLNKAIAKRVISMGYNSQISYHEPIVFSGGVAKNIGVVRAMKEELGKELLVPSEPQMPACLGAAIFARKNA